MVSLSTSVQPLCIHDCEYSRDRFNRIQDFQSFPGYQSSIQEGRDCEQQPQQHWREQQTSVYHIHINRIWRGIVLYSIDSTRC